jgi:coenzyme Q-binding protein COQ10
MPVFRAMRRVPHSADEMFDLVADVERYHEFVPLCVRHAILSRETRGEIEILMTDMTVACGIYRESFKSRVTLDRANGCILVESADGPLRQLRTRWTFQSRSGDSCDVGFYLQYELTSRTLALLMGPVFDVASASCRLSSAVPISSTVAGTRDLPVARKASRYRFPNSAPLRL